MHAEKPTRATLYKPGDYHYVAHFKCCDLNKDEENYVGLFLKKLWKKVASGSLLIGMRIEVDFESSGLNGITFRLYAKTSKVADKAINDLFNVFCDRKKEFVRETIFF